MPCNTPPPAVNPEHIEDHDEEEEDIIYDDDDIIELDVTDESVLSFEAHDEAVFCCNFNKTGSLVVSGGQDETAFVWNINDGDTVFECKGSHTDSVIAADFNHDSSLVATAGMDGIIEVWNVASKTKVWDNEITEITWISWHPNANFLFAGTTSGECWKWLVPDNSVCEVFASHGEGASTGLLISNGTKCVVGYTDGLIKVWDTSGITAVGSSKDHTKNVTCLASSADGNLFISGSEDGTAKLFKTSNCKVLHVWSFQENKAVESLAYVKSHRLFAIGTGSGKLIIIDPASYTERVSVNLQDSIVKIVASDDSPILYIAAGCSVHCYDARNGNPVKKWDGHAACVLDISLSPDQRRFVTASDDFICKLFPTDI